MKKNIFSFLAVAGIIVSASAQEPGKCPVAHGEMKKEEGKCPVTGMGDAAKCPVVGNPHENGRATTNKDWWPNRLNLKVLHQNSSLSNPLDPSFNYAEECKKLDLDAVKKDLFALMTDSQPWWPADYGHYGPLFIRMAWHSAGTYRMGDGRGGAQDGTQRFAPLNSWPDNAGLDKARRLLWPIKKKYGNKISWADLMILAGNCALESMGCKTFGFSLGRVDVWEAQEDVDWGMEKTWLGGSWDKRSEAERQFGAVQMGLIYVNPEGPKGVPDALAAGKEIKEVFWRMGMTVEETVALIAGGHTFGKTHGNAKAEQIGLEPEAAPIEQMGLGWKSSLGTGVGNDITSSGIEGAWKPNPTKWDMGFFKTLFKYDWNLTKSPYGAYQWEPTDPEAKKLVVDAHEKGKTHAPMMMTSDLALRFDPEMGKISRDFMENPDKFADAFARAWFKLTHRDMGPKSRYIGKEAPTEDLIWQDPIPVADYKQIDEQDVANLKKKIASSKLSIHELIYTAWSAAATFRGSDFKGGANGGRLALDPQKNWQVNEPELLAKRLEVYAKIKKDFDAKGNGKKVSMADLIVLGGAVGIEKAAEKAGRKLTVPFAPGRVDATQEMTDPDYVGALEPRHDGFRNYQKEESKIAPEEWLVDRAQLLGLTAPEMTVLVGGLRVMNCNYENSKLGVLTKNEGALTNDFFVNLTDMSTEWKAADEKRLIFIGSDRATGKELWRATRVDLIFGANSELRALAEVYAQDDSKDKFVTDFVKAWNKVMNADRFDLK